MIMRSTAFSFELSSGAQPSVLYDHAEPSFQFCVIMQSPAFSFELSSGAEPSLLYDHAEPSF